MTDLQTLSLAAACGVSLLLSAGLLVVVLTRFSPLSVKEAAQRANGAAEDARARVERIELRMAAWKEELDSFMQAVEDTQARTSTQRKRAETAAAKLGGGPQAAPEPTGGMPRDEQIAWAQGRLRRG